VDVNDNLGQQALQNLSSFEKRVLKDKHVTDAERATTLRVFTQCLTNAGIEYEIDPDQTGIASVWMYGGTAAQAGRTTQDDAAAMDHCIDQVNAIENVWILQHPDNAAGAAPLPGLAQALATLDTSQW
jgi:hypothetical protein